MNSINDILNSSSKNENTNCNFEDSKNNFISKKRLGKEEILNLKEAIEKRNEEITINIINLMENINEEIPMGKYNTQTTILELASEKGEIGIVKYLLNLGANPNTHSGIESYSPLMFACKYNHFEIVEMLILAQADINYIFGNYSALSLASLNNYENII